jgi:hypothetical protein
MPYSLDEIKLFESLDLDIFEIRGAKTGINNARSTSPLYDSGVFNPFKSILYGDATTIAGDSTVFVSGINALNMVEGDVIVKNPDSLIISRPIDATSVLLITDLFPTVTGTGDATFNLTTREYLIEPDVGSNTKTDFAVFTNGQTSITGTGFSDLTSGDSIQLNTYQKYFIVNYVVSDTSCELKTVFDGNTASGLYTAKKWRLDWLMYQYNKNNFTYDNQSGRWEYDTTTGGDQTAHSYFCPFMDGINLKFTPTLKPSKYPDLMDSNTVYGKVLNRSTTYDMFQFPLPAVPNPEESFTLYINDQTKTNGVDYVINYSQLPIYVYPPPMDQRVVANLMFLKGIQDSTLSSTATGIITFTDSSGNVLQGVMPGTETIKVDGTVQIPNEDYVIDLNSGVGYASEVITNEPVIKYVMYQQKGLYDLGLNITKDGTYQQLTIPLDPSDDVLFDLESGRLKPADQDNPNPGEEYIVDYYTEGEYVSNESHTVSDTTNAIRVDNYPIKPQSVILLKNGSFLDENIDYRVSCLTGRIVFFSPLVAADSIDISYAPLINRVNGLTYEAGLNYTTIYRGTSSVTSISPLSFAFPNPALLSDTSAGIQVIYNVTKSDATYDLNGYAFSGTNVIVTDSSYNRSIGTETSDEIAMTYKFQKDGVEYAPVLPINFSVVQDSTFMALVDQSASQFQPGLVVQLKNVDTAGDFFFKISDSTYDGEDTVVYFTGASPSDIVNPPIYLSDTMDTTMNLVPITASPVMSGSTEILFSGSNIADTFRPGELLNIGTDYYSIVTSEYDSSKHINIVSFNVESFRDYTDNLSNIYHLDYPLYYEGSTVLSTKYPIITEPSAPIMALSYNGYATITKDSSAFSVDIGALHYTYLDTSYSQASDLTTALIGLGFAINLYGPDWYTSKLNIFSNLSVTSDSSTLVTGFPTLRLNGVDTTNFTVSGGDLIVTDVIEKTQRYNFDYLGQKSLNDSTVVFSGSYFTDLPAKSKVAVSMKFDNLDQFYIEVMSRRNFLEYVIQPAKTEEAIQQSGNVGQGGDIPGDEAGGNSQGGLINDEFRRADASIECNVFNDIFDFFNRRVQSYADEVYALKGWKLCNNMGLLSEADQAMGALPINRMFPWSDYTSYPPYPITPLTGQAVPYVISGTKKPSKKSPCKATFNGSLVTCGTGPNGFPSYWRYQLRAGDLIRPYDTTVNYSIVSILNDSTMTISPPYPGAAVTKPFIMTSKYPLYDDDGYVGPRVDGTNYEDFGLVDGDVFDIWVGLDTSVGLDQSYMFTDQSNPFMVFYTAQDVAKVLSTALDIKVSVEWLFDSDSAYGYTTGLVARADGTHNSLIVKHGTAVSKLGFTEDSTVFGNFDNTHANPEFVYLNTERADLVVQCAALYNSLSISNKLARPISDATTVKDMATDESSQIYNEMLVTNKELETLQVFLQEPSMPGYAGAVIADASTRQFQVDSSVAAFYDQTISVDYSGFITPQAWIVDLQASDTTVVHGKDSGFGVPVYIPISIVGQSDFAIITTDYYDRQILNNTVDSTMYSPIVVYENDLTAIDGTWLGLFGSYGYNRDATFQIYSVPLFALKADVTSSFTYSIDSSGLWIDSTSFPYSGYGTVLALKSAISAISGLDATGDSIHDSSNPRGMLLISTTAIPPDATLYSGLRECLINYWTIDDKNLRDRSSFDNTRISQLDSRLTYLDNRENQIKSSFMSEEFFMSSDTSGTGNLYEWADNRFNRSVGCEAKLKQIEKQIQVNQSGLTVCRRFL